MESSTLKKKAKDAFDKTTDYLSDAKDSVTENVGDFVDDAKDNLSKVKDKSKEGYQCRRRSGAKSLRKGQKVTFLPLFTFAKDTMSSRESPFFAANNSFRK